MNEHHPNNLVSVLKLSLKLTLTLLLIVTLLLPLLCERLNPDLML